VFEEVLSDGKYYWRVRGFNEDNETLGWSSVYNFELDTVPPEYPNLQSPEEGSDLTENTVQFNWSAVSEAESYWIQIDDNENFGSIEKEKSGITENLIKFRNQALRMIATTGGSGLLIQLVINHLGQRFGALQ